MRPPNAPFRVRVVGTGADGEPTERPVLFAPESGLLVHGTDALWLTVGGAGEAATKPTTAAGE